MLTEEDRWRKGNQRSVSGGRGCLNSFALNVFAYLLIGKDSAKLAHTWDLNTGICLCFSSKARQMILFKVQTQ